jgi:hypothetical protein
MNPPPVSHRVLVIASLMLAGMAGAAACQGRAEPDPPRPPAPVIEARSAGAIVARIVSSHPCRADIEGNELLIGTLPLVAQVGNVRWSGDEADGGTMLRRDGAPVVRVRDRESGIEVFDARGAALLKVTSDGAISNALGETLRRAEPSRTAIRIGEAVVTGTSDVALGVLITAPELIPEIRGLAACHRLFVREQGR